MNYIGSKKHLLDFIESTILNEVGSFNDKVFCDLFAGTGLVGEHFKNKVKKVIANDIEPYAYVLIYNSLLNTTQFDFKKVNYRAKKGFIYEEYAKERSYFSEENAQIIDGIRHWIEKSSLSKNEYNFYLASLIYSADRVANTTGTYGSYLKNMKFMAKTKLKYLPHKFVVNHKDHEVYNEDANILIKKIEGDILYLDPPYNHRQYGLNYHILNTIVQNKIFKPRGKSGFDDYIRSDYCKKTEVKNAFEDIIKNAKFKYVFLSYSDDGILDKNIIELIMCKYGNYKKVKCLHSRLRVNQKSKKGQVTEYIHILEKYSS